MLTRSFTVICLAMALFQLMCASPAQANGTELLKNCTTAVRIANEPNFVPNLFAATTCVSYLEGILQTTWLYQKMLPREKWIVCVPRDIRELPLSRYAEIVVDFLKANPERLREPRFNLVISALKDAFPCFSS